MSSSIKYSKNSSIKSETVVRYNQLAILRNITTKNVTKLNRILKRTFGEGAALKISITSY